MSDHSPPQTTVWRSRPYQLMIFSAEDDRLLVSIDLSPEQAEAIGTTLIPVPGDGIGDYPVDPDGYVCMGPR